MDTITVNTAISCGIIKPVHGVCKDNNKLCILISRYLSSSDNAEIILNDLPYKNAVYTVRRTDKMYTDSEAEKGTVNDNRIELFLPENSFSLITITKA